jgi:hypothetical protein
MSIISKVQHLGSYCAAKAVGRAGPWSQQSAAIREKCKCNIAQIEKVPTLWKSIAG